MFLNPFFNKGRIRRTEYGLTWIIGILLFAGIVSVIFMKTADDRYPLSDLDGFILFFDMILIAWLMISQGTKRAHDISRSGWNQLNPIFFVALPFIEGGTKKNRYGRDPKGRVFVRQKMSIANMLLSFLLPGFILTTIFTPYANDDVAANMKLYEGWKLYQDDDYMFQYPFKWSLDSSKAPSSFIIYTPLDTSEQNSQQVIKIGEDNLIGRGLSLNDYTILSIKDIKKNYKNLVVFSNVEGELNSRACRKVFMEYTEDANIRYALIMYNLVALGKGYYLIFNCEKAQYEKYRTAADSLFASVVLKTNVFD